MLLEFGRIQTQSIVRKHETKALGLDIQPLQRIAEQVHPTIEAINKLVDLSDLEVAQLYKSVPRLEASCTSLASYGLPSTLVHGDLHSGNAALRTSGVERSFVFFDWGDACITHPFLDLVTLIHEDDPDKRARLADPYLQLWTRYQPIHRLREIVDLALILIPIHQLIGLRQLVTQIGEAEALNGPDCMESGVRFWIEKLLSMTRVLS
jgi:thiamine kinase-like enzyme